MDLSLFARGALIGLAIAAPVGPIGVLCIRRTLVNGRLAGFVSGLGAATADLIYGTIAVLGLTALTSVLVGISFWTRLVGGLFLCYLGLSTLREAVRDGRLTTDACPEPSRRDRRPTTDGRPVIADDRRLTPDLSVAERTNDHSAVADDQPVAIPRSSLVGRRSSQLAGAYTSTLLLTLTNPATIIAFAAIFAGLGAGTATRGYGEGLLLVAGVGAGSALWWLVLSGAAGLFRTRLTPRALRSVNIVAGVVILGFGIAALASLALR